MRNIYEGEKSRWRHDVPVGVVGVCIGIVLANVGIWMWAWSLFAHQPALLATAFLAYVFGLRHAVDPDHIAAIDNVVRKLMQEARSAWLTGFFFSIGHALLIFIAVAAIATATVAVTTRIEAFREVGGIIATIVSSTFLLLIAIMNMVIFAGVWRSFRRARRGEVIGPDDMDMLLAGRGLMARLFRPLFRFVSKSWHMAPIGFLFGLGFDTATEIGLFATAANHATLGYTIAQTLVFPALFAAGMVLIDTFDSLLMVRIYGWAYVHPIRKLWYNLVITLASVLVALFIGGLQALGLVADKLHLDGGFWSLVAWANRGLANFGFGVIGLFLASWIGAALIYRWKRYDEIEVTLAGSS